MLYRSPYCSVNVYSLVDTTLKDLVAKGLAARKYRDLFIQTIHVMALVEKEGYIYRDWKMDNVGLVKTKEKMISVGEGRRVPTHGYRVVLIDYGSVLHGKYASGPREKKALRSMSNLYFMFDRHSDNMIYNFSDFEKRNRLPQGSSNRSIAVGKKRVSEMKELLPDKHHMSLAKHLYKILYYEEFEHRINNKAALVRPRLLLPLKDVLLVFKNAHNIQKLAPLLASSH
eukprot:jgi/Mesvir1/1542/Mv14525-RA.1